MATSGDSSTDPAAASASTRRKSRRPRPRVCVNTVRSRAQASSMLASRLRGSNMAIPLLYRPDAERARCALLRGLLLPTLRGPWAHGFGLKWSVAHVEISLEPVLALSLEQLLPELIVGRVRERAKGSFEQKAGIDPGGLHAEHGDGLVESHRRLRDQRDAFCQRAGRVHELVVRDDLVHHADAQGLLRIEMIAGEAPAVGRLPPAQGAPQKARFGVR